MPLKRRNSSSSVELCLAMDDLDVQVYTIPQSEVYTHRKIQYRTRYVQSSKQQ